MPFNPLMLGFEIIYSVIVISLCLLVYYKTKEIYQLTTHRGIYYFRNAFLFFALGYSFKIIASILHLYHVGRIFALTFNLGKGAFFLFMIPSAYASSIAILFLAQSLIWKKFELRSRFAKCLVHLILLIIVFAIFLLGSPKYLLLFQIVLFLFVLLLGFYLYYKEKHISKLYIVYVLLFVFWILNILSFIVARFFSGVILSLNLISIGVFFLIAWKVIKIVNVK